MSVVTDIINAVDQFRAHIGKRPSRIEIGPAMVREIRDEAMWTTVDRMARAPDMLCGIPCSIAVDVERFRLVE